MTLPSLELIGKNANGRDVILRVDIHKLPLTDEQWYAMAVEAGLPADLDKTRGNIVVGHHYGFAGTIKAYDTLADANRAAAWVKDMDGYDSTRRAKVILRRHANAMGVGVMELKDLHGRSPVPLRLGTWRDAANYCVNVGVMDYTETSDAIYDFIPKVLDVLDGMVSYPDLIAKTNKNRWAYEDEDGTVWVVQG